MSKITFKHKGQSLVEFALTITLIFFMFSAAIDFGLAFFAFQGISGAAQEGAAYASLKPMVGTAVNDEEIKKRVMNEGGLKRSVRSYPHQVRFMNLHDLNANNTEEDSTDLSFITITSTKLSNFAPPSINCTNNRTAQFCQMHVEVKYNYKPFFIGANLFGTNNVQLKAKRSMTITR